MFIRRKGLLIPNRKVIYFSWLFFFLLAFPHKPEAWGQHVTMFTSRVLRKQMSLWETRMVVSTVKAVPRRPLPSSQCAAGLHPCPVGLLQDEVSWASVHTDPASH